MSLSEKAIRDYSNNPIPDYYWSNDVRESVRKIKERIEDKATAYGGINAIEVKEIIDEEMGDKLV